MHAPFSSLRPGRPAPVCARVRGQAPHLPVFFIIHAFFRQHNGTGTLLCPAAAFCANTPCAQGAAIPAGRPFRPAQLLKLARRPPQHSLFR